MTRIAVYFRNRKARTLNVDEIYEETDQTVIHNMLTTAMIQGCYDYVARIEATDIHDAYRQTQHDNHPETGWHRAEHVSYFKGMADFDGEARSSQCGDIFVVDGKAYMVGRGCSIPELPFANDFAAMFAAMVR